MDFLFQSPPKTPQELPTMKYYPIFDRRWRSAVKEMEQARKADDENKKSKSRSKSMSKMGASKPYDNQNQRKASRKQLFKSSDQYFLDCGQKDFDPIRCNVCNMLYTIGEQEDEKTHESYHDTFVNGIRYRTWKREDIVELHEDGRILRVRSDSPHFMLKKLDELFRIADIELGVNVDLRSSLTATSQFFLFVSNVKQRIVAFVSVERISFGSWLTSEDPLMASTQLVAADCGVSRIWIHPNFRRRAIATRLLDAVRRHFLGPNQHLPKDRVAFSDPTLIGIQFAKSYMRSNRFLIYFCNTNTNHKLIEQTSSTTATKANLE